MRSSFSICAGAVATVGIALLLGFAPAALSADSGEPAPAEWSTVSGEVVYDGAAAKGGTVLLSGAGSPTKYRGEVSERSYSIPGVPPGGYRVFYAPPEGDTTQAGVVLVRAGVERTAYDLKLEKTVAASGVVVDAAGGEPVAGATVELLREGQSPGTPRQADAVSVKTDEKGEFRAGGLVRAKYTLHVFAKDCRAVRDGVDLTKGDVAKLRYAVEKSNTRVGFVVRDTEGNAQSGPGFVSFRKPGERASTGRAVSLKKEGATTTVTVSVDPGEYDVAFRMSDGRFGPPVRVTLVEGTNGPLYLTVPAR